MRTVLKAPQNPDPLSLEQVLRDPGIFFADVPFIPPEDLCLSPQNRQVHVRQHLRISIRGYLSAGLFPFWLCYLVQRHRESFCNR